MIPLLSALLAIAQVPVIQVPNPTPIGNPYIVSIRDLRTTPIPPNPVRVVARVMLLDKGVMIGDTVNNVWVMNVPTEAVVGIAVGSLLDVTGSFNGSAIIATSYVVYFSESDSVYREMMGRSQPSVPDPVTIYGTKKTPLPATVRGTVSFKVVPLVISVSADYSDIFGRSYKSTLVDRSSWVVDIDSLLLTVTQGAGSSTSNYKRVGVQ